MPPTSFVRYGAGLLAFACAAAALRTDAAPTPSAAPKAVTAPHATPPLRVAPADEYFGRLKMSVLGIRNKVKDLGLDADLHPERAHAVLGTALQVEDALRDWAHKYPADSWLPRYAYALETLYERISGDDAHGRAIRQLKYIVVFFPKSAYARIGRAKLDVGVPTPSPAGTTGTPDSAQRRLALIDGKVAPTMPPLIHLVPLNPLTVVASPAAVPLPSASPGADLSVSPSASLSVSPSASPSASP